MSATPEELGEMLAAEQAPLWTPSPEFVKSSAMARFMEVVSRTHALKLERYDDLWRWSVEEPEAFWVALAEFFGVIADGDWTLTRRETEMSGTGWFPGVRLNYAENVLRHARSDVPAVVSMDETGDIVELSWADLARQVAALTAQLAEWGVGPGDRVAAYVPNIPEALVALLATTARGATWCCCAPDLGAASVVARFGQIEPTVLIAVNGYRFGGVVVDRSVEVAEIAVSLPTVGHVVGIDSTGTGLQIASVEMEPWEDIVHRNQEMTYERVAFDHPLWILYSSGTTGSPKAIVHSHGGITLEHQKWLGLHTNVGSRERFFWHTSTTWMAWNALVSAMLLGATAVLYSGSPLWPDVGALWHVAAATSANYFGTGGAYIARSYQAKLEPGTTEDFSALTCLMAAGSPLPHYGWEWVYQHVKGDLRLDAASGGTDACTAYVAACPLEPIYAGEVQCRALAERVESWDEQGKSVVDEIGELVVTAPFPSMPLGFWNDSDGRRFREAYFEMFPGIWRHGDWITITSRGTAIVHGRSDSTINRNGVRMGSADIYAAVEQIPDIADCLVVGAEFPDGDYYMPLFVTLAEGVELDDSIRNKILTKIREDCSPRHVPDEILEAPAIPRTLTGKRLEVPVKRVIQGVPIETAVGDSALENRLALEFFDKVGESRRQRASRYSPSA